MRNSAFPARRELALGLRSRCSIALILTDLVLLKHLVHLGARPSKRLSPTSRTLAMHSRLRVVLVLLDANLSLTLDISPSTSTLLLSMSTTSLPPLVIEERRNPVGRSLSHQNASLLLEALAGQSLLPTLRRIRSQSRGLQMTSKLRFALSGNLLDSFSLASKVLNLLQMQDLSAILRVGILSRLVDLETRQSSYLHTLT